MRTIYIDSDFKCHVYNNSSMVEIDVVAFFDGKCDAFVEGYRFIPAGERWAREDGAVFTGEMVSPWKPYAELAAAQAQYEADLAEAAAAYQEGVNSAYDT